MGKRIGAFSQKGGVGKTTICEALAATYTLGGWDVLLADLDIDQSSSYEWLLDRLQNPKLAPINVQAFGTAASALKASDKYDLTIFDGRPLASSMTVELAKVCDLIILPTGMAKTDMRPTVRLANTLVDKHGVDPSRIALVLNHVGNSGKELVECRNFLMQTDYTLLPSLYEQDCYRRAQDAGKSIVETQFAGPREQADSLITAIDSMLTKLSK
ncbi:ParA family protein [Pseudomonas sp. Sample_23]|uniref:ParA family protein n=1 Tax=Pseudomonas sp. Sample_23 TaxID=2448267 RepID=UPI001032B9DB|nr:ParA family protein [Pseudomonas sp. Sample_23]